MQKKFTEEQIIGFLREAETNLPVAQLYRRHSFVEASHYLWRNKFGGISVLDAKRLKELRHMLGRGLGERRSLQSPVLLTSGDIG